MIFSIDIQELVNGDILCGLFFFLLSFIYIIIDQSERRSIAHQSERSAPVATPKQRVRLV